MTSMMSARALAASVVAATMLAMGSAAAQTYPDRPVTMLVAFPPGGADDAIARIIQDPLQKALGQPIVIENIGGAGGSIAAAKARARRARRLHHRAAPGRAGRGDDALSEPHL